MRLSSKNNDPSLCYDVIITHQNLKIDKFDDFCALSIIVVGQTYLDVISLIINQW